MFDSSNEKKKQSLQQKQQKHVTIEKLTQWCILQAVSEEN